AMPKSVARASSTGSFAGSISAERVDDFDDVDILVTYGDQTLLAAMKANPLLAHMPAVQHEAIVLLGRDPVGTAANPTPLSVTWVLPDYVRLLAEAARKTE
ncbi:MAG: iron-siderophore ABC transporter substrate-binding protein, partial [Pseudomonadota bacterium]|nr:iron-siderophore ABC transporter substrate-binding protein [Pseudomonadota bacterium]